MASKTTKDHKYTEVEDSWLRDNIDVYTYPELTRKFNELFGTNVQSVSDRCLKRLKLKKTVNTGNCLKGQRRCLNTLPIGSERIASKALWVKVDDQINNCQNRRMPCKTKDINWERKDVLTWKAAGRIIPDGQLLVHLNMDLRDCSLENLYCVPRKINFMMAKNKWYTDNRENTLTAIKWCELFYAIKNYKYS